MGGKVKRAVLIFPRPISEMPTGFAYLNSVFKQKGYEVKAIVNTFKKNYSNEDILKIINEYEPSIIGINIGTLAILETYKLIKAIDKTKCIVIAGGPHATTCPEEVIKNGVDIVIRNEGEETLAEVLDWVNGNTKNWLPGILGISYINHITYNGQIFHNPQRPYIKDLKDLPTPDFSCFNYDDFKTSDGLIKGLHRIYCSRGCVGICSYCDSAIFGHKVRYRPINEIIEEIKFRYENYGIESFIIADDTFTASKKYVKEFCKALKDNNLPIIWGCSTRASAVNDEILQIMKDAGCYLIGFGIESGDPNSLKLMKKGITLEQAHNAINTASKYGFRLYINLMVGFPWETEEAILNQIKYIETHFNQVYVYQVSGSLVPYPGTGIYEDWKDKSNIKDWWLRPDYQNYGIQIHQNSTEPFKLNTYYQRKLYDDTYVFEGKFFNYTKEYKNLVKKMAFLIGKRNLLSEEKSEIKRWVIYNLCKVSRVVYELSPNFEKKVIPLFISLFNFKSKFHDHGPIGYVRRKING